MRLITKQEAKLCQVRALAQRGLNYHHETEQFETPIMDAAFVTMPLDRSIGCLELCMYAEGSRHQEEIIVTGTKGRLEAYLPENKVYLYQRPLSHEQWTDRSEPPPLSSIEERVFDCSNVMEVHDINESETIPTHGGYHYSSTAVEWYKLLRAMRSYDETRAWKPLVSLDDGIKAVEIGLRATEEIVNETKF